MTYIVYWAGADDSGISDRRQVGQSLGPFTFLFLSIVSIGN